MKRSPKRLLLIITLFISGCASTVTSPTVEDNMFISYEIPKLMIKVSDKLVYRTGGKNNFQGTDSYGSLSTTGISIERYIFRNYRTKSGLVIMIQKFNGVAGGWEMETPNYSSHPGKIVTGSTKMNGTPYSTGIYLNSQENGWFLYKSYGTIFGAGNDIRFQIHYRERIHTPSPTSEFVEEFSSKADNSFTILPYTATKPNKMSQHNEYIKQNADKTDGTSCRDSLECAKGYFCINSKCTKGFTN